MNTLEALHQADWKGLQLRLLEHALFRVSRLYWRTSMHVLPKGISAEDLVVQAIQKTFEGARTPEAAGVRRWNPEKQPDLYLYLRSVIDSDVNHLVSSEEHRMTDYGVDNASLESGGKTPEERLLEKEDALEEAGSFEAMMRALRAEFAGDTEVTLVLDSYVAQSGEEGAVKPAKVATETGLGIQEVRNAIKRIRRKILSIRTSRMREGPIDVSI